MLHGRYLWIADEIVIDELTASTITDVEDVVRTNEIGAAMTIAKD